MLHAARGADVILMNFHHVFDDSIREQLYLQLGIESGEVLLLIDEAHNLGDAVQSVQSVSLGDRDLEGAESELLRLRGKVRSVEAVGRVFPQVRRFMELLRASREGEDWFDPAIFERMVVQGSLYANMDAIVDDMLTVSEAVRERNMKAGEFRESAVERLTTFLYRIFLSAHDPAYLTVYRRDEEEVIIEVRNIDPQEKILELARSHAATILISGTLSPVESFRRLYFGEEKVSTLTLPNAFPKESPDGRRGKGRDNPVQHAGQGRETSRRSPVTSRNSPASRETLPSTSPRIMSSPPSRTGARGASGARRSSSNPGIRPTHRPRSVPSSGSRSRAGPA